MKQRTVLLHMLCLLAMLSVTYTASAFKPPVAQTLEKQPEAVLGEMILIFKPETPPANRQALAKAHGGELVEHIPALNGEVAFFPHLARQPDQAAAHSLMSTLRQQPGVRHVEPNLVYTTTTTPNDPYVSSQWAWSTIQAYRAWDTTQGAANIKIAIIDSGIQSSHPDLDAKLVRGYDFVDGDAAPEDGNGHGTHVAGSAAAETNNGTGGAGTCPACRIMPIRVLDDAGSGTLSDVAEGIVFAADQGAQVINLSLGGGGSVLLEMAVDYAWDKGAFLACAAGNDGTTSITTAYPAPYNNCFAVAATTSADTRARFSNYGAWVEVAAPGASIVSTWLADGYATVSGTSMAAPHVAGLAGLLSSQGLSNAQIRERICTTADPIAGTGSEWTCGRINAAAAVAETVQAPPPNTAPTPMTPAPTIGPAVYVPLVLND